MDKRQTNNGNGIKDQSNNLDAKMAADIKKTE